MALSLIVACGSHFRFSLAVVVKNATNVVQLDKLLLIAHLEFGGLFIEELEVTFEFNVNAGTLRVIVAHDRFSLIELKE